MPYFRLTVTIFLCYLFFYGNAQKLVYSPRVEGWESSQLPDESELVYTVFLAGDTKYPSPENEVFQLLKAKLKNQSENSALIVLGDIVYNYGLPDESDPDYQMYADTLMHILKSVEDFQGRIFFIPGNHDWAQGRSEGRDRLRNLEKFIQRYLNRGNVFLPTKGRPGPVEVNLSEDISLVVFDTQWWFHKYDKPKPSGYSGTEDESGLITEIKDILRLNRNKKVIFAAHHPLYSVGIHGGHFPLSSLLFPFTEKNEKAIIPAPGFIYTSYRKYFGSIQDLAHPDYKMLINYFEDIFKDFPDLIYAAGHEHNLQYVQKNNLHHIISGGVGEATYVAARKNQTDFAAQSMGFSELKFYNNGDVWIEFICPDETDQGKVLFRKKLFNKPIFNEEQKEIELSKINYSDSIVKTGLTDIYKAGNFRKLWMGENYRQEWNAEVNFPVFDIGTEKGGLEIIKRGGGMQTRSIRMENANENQYVLRSVNKYVERALPRNLRNTFAIDLVQDGISASHPYAAITVPKMADAIGVMHTNPKLVWLPDDPRLGNYRDDIANGVFLFEERASGKWKDLDSFGNTKEIVSTDDVIEEIYSKHDHKVDQYAVLKARLFDIVLSDWDRHEDQWRWAKFKDDDRKIYRPIPRDRDQVYFVNQGVLPKMLKRNWMMPKFQDFNDEKPNFRGLCFNARYFDRSFLNEMTQYEWLQTAQNIQENLTDSVIHAAVSDFPKEVYQISGEKIEQKLIARRDKLQQYANEYYAILSKAVDVVGTDDRELFEAKRLANGNVDLTVTALTDKKGKEKETLYHREFKYDETKEIRLYGLEGKDKYEIIGNGNQGIKIRIISGKGKDNIKDYSKVTGLSKKTIIYDRKDKKNKIKPGSEARLVLSNKKSVNKYDSKQYKHSATAPMLLMGYNIDDGLFIGGGFNSNHYNFRNSTYNKLYFLHAYQTGAFSVIYKGLFSSVSQHFDLSIKAEASIPRSVENFFGFGNETQRLVDSKSFYRMRYQFININPMLQFKLSKYIRYSIGGFYQSFNVSDTTGRYVAQLYPEVLSTNDFRHHHYAGVNGNFIIDMTDNKVMPRRGIIWASEVTDYFGLNNYSSSFVNLKSDLSLYLSFRSDPRAVLALRAGGAMNIGDYEFFHSNFIGGKTNVRGLYSNRYAGDKSFYQNTELRIKLSNLQNYIFNGQLGILLFNDIGRVWYENEDSKRWHRGSGIGIWVTPFDFTALTVTYNFAKEENSFGFTLKFLY